MSEVVTEIGVFLALAFLIIGTCAIAVEVMRLFLSYIIGA